MIRTTAIVFVAACSSGTSSNPGPTHNPGGTGSLTVELLGFRNDTGQAMVGLYVGPEGFPEDREAAVAGKAAPIRGRRATVRFENVPAGRVALAAFHDEDENGRMKRGVVGQPKEGYGFSRDARARFGPPDFDDAAVKLAAGEDKTIRIHIRY